MPTKKKNNKKSKYPFVSVCTPTFNRRPFIPYMIKCFNHQTYPKDKIEWIVVDDGTDKIEELLKDIPQIKYFKYDTKMTLGQKRNIMHSKCKGDIIVYMDDDDYYPPERISHAVEMLQKHPEALCGGSSIMNIYFKHINKMFQFGPYGEKHATAATFAFRRELLEDTSYDDSACLAEEKGFLKNYTVPFVQFDSLKTILVFSHIHNSFDKKDLLNQSSNNPFIKETSLNPGDVISDKDILMFFLKDIDALLLNYDPGSPMHKPDVLTQIEEIKHKREEAMKERNLQNSFANRVNSTNDILQNSFVNKINNMTIIIQELSLENTNLRQKVVYLENKLMKYNAR